MKGFLEFSRFRGVVARVCGFRVETWSARLRGVCRGCKDCYPNDGESSGKEKGT